MTSAPISLVHLGRVTSTMDVLDELISEGAPPWTVVLADEQTAGRGRGGRVWEADPGAAMQCSVLVRPSLPDAQWGMLAIAVGVAVAEYVDSLGVAASLKWPNDVLMDGRKLGGILIRSRVIPAGRTANIGIGLNLRPSRRDWSGRAAISEKVQPAPTATEAVQGIVHRLACALTDRKPSDVRDAWTERAAFLGETVTVVDGGRAVTGTMVGIDSAGRLQLRDGAGLVQQVTAGDLVRGPRPGPA